MKNQIANQMKPSDLVDEYIEKTNALPELYELHSKAVKNLEMGCSVMGQYGGNIWRRSSPEPNPTDLQRALLVSAWKRVYFLWIKDIATAKDKAKIELMLEKPPEFTIENIRDQFGKYVTDPWETVLRGLAEVFCGLDAAYKSHSKVKIGVEGLPKRIIISGFNGYSSYGQDKLTDLVNALRACRRQPLTSYLEIRGWIDAAKKSDNSELIAKSTDKNTGETIERHDGLFLTLFKNGNGHVKFGKRTLVEINKALAQYYGEVLPDVDDKPDKKQASKNVSKDLQYYPTPKKVADRLVHEIGHVEGLKVLEPSCGCGRIMDALSKAGFNVQGIEVDHNRANQARAKGHAVTVRNFLDLEPTPVFDFVVMNPPFYGKHYIKHIEAASRWLKPGGGLISILPASARYDHKIINKKWLEAIGAWGSKHEMWRDLPVGSFSESGTNINTVVLKIIKHEHENKMEKAA